LKQTWSVMLARFPGSGMERTEIVDWIAQAQVWGHANERIGKILNWQHISGALPVSAARNRSVRDAIDLGVDFLVMLDSDMAPDIGSKPFLPTAFDFATERWQTVPTVIAAPYLMGAPESKPVVGRWASNNGGSNIFVSMYTREEAATMTGIQPAPFLGTGLTLFDVRVFAGFTVGERTIKAAPPWFEFEFEEPYHDKVVCGEDIHCTRNIAGAFAAYGLETNYCAWDCWSDHVKSVRQGKPIAYSMLDVAEMFRG
jgi:hypothetical protein